MFKQIQQENKTARDNPISEDRILGTAQVEELNDIFLLQKFLLLKSIFLFPGFGTEDLGFL